MCGFPLLEEDYVLIPKALEDLDMGQEGVLILPFCNSSHEWGEGNSIYDKSPTALFSTFQDKPWCPDKLLLNCHKSTEERNMIFTV